VPPSGRRAPTAATALRIVRKSVGVVGVVAVAGAVEEGLPSILGRHERIPGRN
jgi:hypothetical protein